MATFYASASPGSLPAVTKAPTDAFPIAYDFSGIVANDSIATTTVTPDAGLTASAGSSSGMVATVSLSGGTAGGDYLVRVAITITGAPGISIERALCVHVRDPVV